MNPRTLSRSILEYSIIAFVAVALLDPADQIFGLKTPLFAAALFVWVYRWAVGFTKGPSGKVWMVLIAVAGLIPLTATFIGVLNGAAIEQAPTFAVCKAFMLLFLLPVVLSEGFDLLQTILRLSGLVAFITIAMVLIWFLSPIVFGFIYQFTLNRQNAIINETRDTIGFGLGGFYYKTSVVLIFPLAYYLEQTLRSISIRPLVFVLIYSFSLIASGSRANLIMLLLAWTILGLRRLQQSRGWIGTSLAALALITLSSTLLVPKLFDPAETSNTVKIAHYHSYVDQFEQHPEYLLWGQGADTQFYSEGFQKRTAVTELTYFELVRNFGLVLAAFLLICLAIPLYPLFRDESHGGLAFLAVAYLCYIFAAGSNPLLMSSTGMLVTTSVWQKVLSRSASPQKQQSSPSHA